MELFNYENQIFLITNYLRNEFKDFGFEFDEESIEHIIHYTFGVEDGETCSKAATEIYKKLNESK